MSNVANRNSKITIAMPVFNGGNYFRQALESALRQSHANIEIVVVDDGSTDGGVTEVIAKGTGSPKVRYFRQENLGTAGALNRAIQEATGDFFCWLSHDDLYKPHKIAAQVHYHSRIGKAEAILFSDFDLIDGHGQITQRVRLDPKPLLRSSKLALMHSYINGCTLFIPFSVLYGAGPFDENLRFTQDYEMWNRLLPKYDFFLQSEALVQYRVHSGQGSNHPEAVREANLLWQRMMGDLTVAERAQMFGSGVSFFRSMASFLGRTPYEKAAQFARAQGDQSLRATLVSVIVPSSVSTASDLRRSVESVLLQTHASIEVIIAPVDGWANATIVKELCLADPRVRVQHASAGDEKEIIANAIQLANGEYIAFLEPPASFAPIKIDRQLTSMAVAGSWLSYTKWDDERSDSNAAGSVRAESCYCGMHRRAPLWSTLMVHRLLVAAGFEPGNLTCEKTDWLWAELAARHHPLTLDHSLTTLRA